jgi:hypothetical protein
MTMDINYSSTARELSQPPFTPEKLAERWACSPDQVRALCRRNKLAHFTVGRGLYRIPPKAVEQYEQCGSSAIAATDTQSDKPKLPPRGGRSAPKIVMLPGVR